MADRIENHGAQAPRTRIRPGLLVAEFFPGEVARLLGLNGIDYAQLREMHKVGRLSRGLPAPGRGWARFSLADLATLEVLLTLGGGRGALLAGRRLVLGDVTATCDSLRGLGFDNPLLQVPLAREGRRILARVDGFVFEPATGQLVLASAWQRVDAFLTVNVITNKRIRKALAAERRSISPAKRRILITPDELGTLDGVLAI